MTIIQLRALRAANGPDSNIGHICSNIEELDAAITGEVDPDARRRQRAESKRQYACLATALIDG